MVARCWEAMVRAAAELERLHTAMTDAAQHELHDADEMDRYVDTIAGHAASLNDGVSELVRAAYQRVSPVEGLWNRWVRRGARLRLSAIYGQLPPDETP
jgi:phage replication-related protein YjqB (UPF0714/DUF867 family)